MTSGWHITIDYADGRPRREVFSAIASPPVAVETALREIGMGDERTGSFQITVTMKGGRNGTEE